MSEYYFSLYVWKNILIASFAISFFLIAWFETHAFVEYARLVGFRLKGYERSEQMGLDLPAHLALKHDCFFKILESTLFQVDILQDVDKLQVVFTNVV